MINIIVYMDDKFLLHMTGRTRWKKQLRRKQKEGVGAEWIGRKLNVTVIEIKMFSVQWLGPMADILRMERSSKDNKNIYFIKLNAI